MSNHYNERANNTENTELVVFFVSVRRDADYKKELCVKKDSCCVYFPILIDLRRFPCLVVGGGRVALRKVLSLLEFDASVTVVSPRICRELTKLSARGRVKLIRKPYSWADLSNIKIVFSATNSPGINRTVSRDCRRKGILLNVADGPSLCDFIMPATLKRGDLSVSVSSQGRAPFYTREMKRRLETLIPDSVGEVTDLAGLFRQQLLSNGSRMSKKAKQKALRKFLSTDWESILSTKGRRKTYQYLEKLLMETEGLQDL